MIEPILASNEAASCKPCGHSKAPWTAACEVCKVCEMQRPRCPWWATRLHPSHLERGKLLFFEWSSCQFIVFSSRVWRDVIRFIVIGSQCTSQGTSAFDSAEVRRKACHLFHHLMWKCVAKNNLWCYSMWVFGSWDIWCCYVSFFSDPLIAGVPWTSEYSHLDVRLLTEVLKSLLTNCFDCEVRPLYPFQRHNSPFLRKPKLRDGWTVLVTYVWGINGNIYLFD